MLICFLLLSLLKKDLSMSRTLTYKINISPIEKRVMQIFSSFQNFIYVNTELTFIAIQSVWCQKGRVKGPIHDHKNSQYFQSRNGHPIFYKVFDTKLATHVPSKFWPKFIVFKMFDPDAAVAVALVFAKCSPEVWIFDQYFDSKPHTFQNIEELLKYWLLVKIYQTDLIRQYFEPMQFFYKKSSTHRQKSRHNFLSFFLLQNIDFFFDRVWVPSASSYVF